MRFVSGLGLVFLLACWATAQDVSGEKKDEQYDVVKLKNGHEFVGRITEENRKYVSIVFRGGEIQIPKRRIQEIVRATRKEVEKAATEVLSLGRFEERRESFYVYYLGHRVGWRETSLSKHNMDGKLGFLFTERTVFLKKDGQLDLDLRLEEFIDKDLHPTFFRVSEVSPDWSSLTSGHVRNGHLAIHSVEGGKESDSEILFDPKTEFMLPLLRRLADTTHFPDKGEVVKVFDSLRSRFSRVHATRTLRKELVAGRHQFVTVWRFDEGDRAREIWVDGYGGVVREELGGRHMVALRADPENVAAYAKGDPVDDDTVDLSLAYENVPSGYRLARPNLTWSFELPEDDGALSVSLLNPTQQASVDVIVIDRIGQSTEPETIAMDLLRKMEMKSRDFQILYQKPQSIGGRTGIRFEAEGDHKGNVLRTLGQISVGKDRAYALLASAPLERFDAARKQLELILRSFELTAPPPADGAQ